MDRLSVFLFVFLVGFVGGYVLCFYNVEEKYGRAYREVVADNEREQIMRERMVRDYVELDSVFRRYVGAGSRRRIDSGAVASLRYLDTLRERYRRELE
jgi:hypothetical protein